MFDVPPPSTPLHHFLFERAEALQSACLLLGGRPWLRQAQAVLDELSADGTVTRKTSRRLERILSLLRLNHVEDETRPEAAFFAALDPAAPYVEEICLLSEELAETLASCGSATPRLGIDFGGLV
jgi:hypothetical protein